MKTKLKIIKIQNCGKPKGKSTCGSWAGDTVGETTIKIAA